MKEPETGPTVIPFPATSIARIGDRVCQSDSPDMKM
jgi:hypothetical protein